VAEFVVGMKTQEEFIDWSFQKPSVRMLEHQRSGVCSVLYLLRREIIETLGYHPDHDTEKTVIDGGSKRRLFASTILMFTALDLLAKYMFGLQRGNGAVFKEFVQSPKGAGIPRADAELLWSFRNALVHGFSLPDSEQLKMKDHPPVGLGQRKLISSNGLCGHVVVGHEVDAVVVYVDGLYFTVVCAIENYRETLLGSSSSEARKLFEQVFATHGTIRLSQSE
jgi:hypothetical protein